MMDETKKNHLFIIIGLVIAGVLFWYLRGVYYKSQTVPREESAALVDQAPVEVETSLGGEIYDQANNPIKGKIPESQATVTNPIDGVYQNPFE